MNPLFNRGGMPQQAQNMQGILSQVKQMRKAMQSAKDPQSVLEHMTEQNPALQQVVEMCHGKDPEQIFYGLCEKQGIDPKSILSALE